MLEILFGWRKASKCRDLIKSVRCRLKLVRSRRDTIIRQLREDVVQLLKNGQDESAFTWVEQLFKNQSILAAYDLLDHFCEFIIINLPYIRRHRDCPNDVNEAVSSLIFAATRCVDLPELQMLRKLFGERYGEDFVVVAVELCPGNHVNKQISENLCISSISDDAKQKLVQEIAKDHNLQLECPEIEDGCKLQEQQVHFNKESVYDPSVKNSSHCLIKQFSNRNFQVHFGDIRRGQVEASNDKEKLHIYQQGHFGHTNLLQEKATSDFSLHCKKTAPSPSQSHEAYGISSSIGVSDVSKCASDILEPLNSATIHTSMQEVETLNKFDPSYERTFVYLGDAEDIHFSMLDYDEDSDQRCLASTNSLLSNKFRKPYEEKHTPETRPNRSKTKIEITSSHGGGKHKDECSDCSSLSRAGRARSSGLSHCNCAQMIKKFEEMQDTSVSYRNYSKRKSERTSSRKSELHGDCASTNELGHRCRINRIPSRKILHRRDYSMSVVSSVKDVEYAIYYDESCGDSEVSFLNLKHKISQDHHHHRSILNLADGLHMNKHQKEILPSNGRKHPFPKSYYVQKTSEVSSCTSHGCKRRSCNNCSLKCDKVHDCCLEHPCYFLASDNKIDWESLPPKMSCVTTLKGSPSSILLQEQTNPYYPHNHGSNRIETTNRQATCTGGATTVDAMSTRPCVDLNCEINSSCSIHSQSLRSQKNEVALKKASNCYGESNSSSSISFSSENMHPSSGSWTKMRPPYLRVTANRTPRSASFLFQQPNRHVHPKLPDYDEIAAKFTALKKEHSQRNRSLIY